MPGGINFLFSVIKDRLSGTADPHVIFKNDPNRSVLKTSLAGVHHGGTVFVAGLNHLIVIHGATGLNNRFHPLFKSHVNPVPEGEKGITDHGGTHKTTLPGLYIGNDSARRSSSCASRLKAVA